MIICGDWIWLMHENHADSQWAVFVASVSVYFATEIPPGLRGNCTRKFFLTRVKHSMGLWTHSRYLAFELSLWPLYYSTEPCAVGV